MNPFRAALAMSPDAAGVLRKRAMGIHKDGEKMADKKSPGPELIDGMRDLVERSQDGRGLEGLKVTTRNYASLNEQIVRGLLTRKGGPPSWVPASLSFDGSQFVWDAPLSVTVIPESVAIIIVRDAARREADRLGLVTRLTAGMTADSVTHAVWRLRDLQADEMREPVSCKRTALAALVAALEGE